MLFAIVAALGCDRPLRVPADDTPRPEGPSVALRVWVVNDPPLAAAIGRLRGEWAESAASTLAVDDRPLADLLSDTPPEADLFVFATRHLGELCERNVLRPVRAGVLSGETYSAADVFPLVRDELIRYGSQTMALPLGVQVPLMCYRDDVVTAPPADWTDYAEMARSLAEQQLPAVEPIETEYWAAYLLLARAAPLAVGPRQEAVLFDAESMQPRISEPPFVRALQQLAEAHREGAIAVGSCRDVFASRSGLAIDTPLSGQAVDESGKTSAAARVSWAELPGSGEFFNAMLGEWEAAADADRRVPLLGIGGRLVAVTSASRNAASAFRLLAWLTSSEVGSQLGPASAATMPCRQSQLARSAAWFDPIIGRTGGTRIGQRTRDSHSRDQCLVVPRIPGVDEYLEALAGAVDRVISNDAAPKAALQQAADQWDAITDRRGRQQQRMAYLRHLNLSD